MHIVIDAHLAVREIDGVTRYLNGLLTELPKLDAGIDYTILSLSPQESGLPDRIFNFSNVQRRQVTFYGPSLSQHLVMRKLLKSLGADLYHHPHFDLPVGIEVPSVATIHDLKFLVHPEFFRSGNRLKSFYIRHALQRTVRQADKLIAVSEHTRRDLSRLTKIDDKKITVIHHGIDGHFFGPRNTGTVIAKLPKDFVLFVGTRRPHKNIEGLIRAIEILRKHRKIDIDLVIAGKAYANYDEPQQLSKALNLRESIHFLDFVEDDQLAELFQKARAVALVSFYEGFGFPLIEAMSYGTPVIGSNVTSGPEVVGKAGLLADPHSPEDIADKIQSILEDENLRRNLSELGQKRAKRFTWNSVAKSTLNVYNTVLSQRK